MAKSTSPFSVLIVDDESAFREMLTVFLKPQGFTVETVTDGVEAINRLQKSPLILMTGKAQKAGAWDSDPDIDYLAKPFTAADLLAAVDRSLSPKSRGK